MDSNVAASLAQLSPFVKRLLDGFNFLIQAPIARQPYVLSVAAAGGQVIAAGAFNQPLNAIDFNHSLEWPFEIEAIRFSNDAQHTFRDWRVLIKDLNFAQDWMKNPAMVDTLIDANTGAWKLTFPWIIRPQGGGLQIFVDNLDAVNPININIALIGSQLIPQNKVRNGING